MQLRKSEEIVSLLKLDVPTFYNVVSKINNNKSNNSINNVLFGSDLKFLPHLIDIKNAVSQMRSSAAAINADLIRDISLATKTNPFSSLQEQERDAKDFLPTIDGVTFIFCIYRSCLIFEQIYTTLFNITRSIKKPFIHVSQTEFRVPKNLEEMQLQKLEFDSNCNAVQNYIYNLLDLATMTDQANFSLKEIKDYLEKYYIFLKDKHTVQGQEIFKNALATDIAHTIIANVDAHGELQTVKDPSKISAYSANRALALVQFVMQNKLIQESMLNPGAFINDILQHIDNIQIFCRDIEKAFASDLKIIEEVLGGFGIRKEELFSEKLDIATFKSTLKTLDPASVVSGKNTKMLSREEKFANSFTGESIEKVVEMLCDGSTPPKDIRDFILERKSQFITTTQIENCFYTCRIGGGNPFLGTAPGAIEIMSSPKPNVNIDDIKGSGFQEVKDFVKSIQSANDFRDLFLATSPSKTADKSNCLLIGPPGGGKTLIMKALASQKGFAVIVANGSDFFTCWKGEDIKNPKRLFEHALRVSQDTGNHVHICIDEIDAIINNDKHLGETNLTLEFQILMDGMVDYPKISVWGATNNPERIPMPMIRRFAKVLIVGELNKQERKDLLKLYTSCLPQEPISDEVWDESAHKLEGATGDIIRKIADIMWRSKMSSFVAENPEKAKELVELLNKEKQFDISEFSEDNRKVFLTELKKSGATIDARYLRETIDLALKQISINDEIETAVNSYNRARKFMTQIESKNRSQLILS